MSLLRANHKTFIIAKCVQKSCIHLHLMSKHWYPLPTYSAAPAEELAAFLTLAAVPCEEWYSCVLCPASQPRFTGAGVGDLQDRGQSVLVKCGRERNLQ